MFYTKNFSDKAARQLGYKRDQDGIFARYHREKLNWEHHLNKTKNCITSLIKESKVKSVTILGSGWLLDIPMDVLLENCQKIYLVDIHHPQEIKEKYASNKVEFIEYDIIGLVEPVYQKLKPLFKRGKVNDIMQLQPKIDINFNSALVLSVNILDQLDTILLDAIRKKIVLTNEQIESLQKQIQQSHIHLLYQYNSAIIYTKYEQSIGKSNETIQRCKAEIKGSIIDKWDWIFDTKGRYNPQVKTIFKIEAKKIGE